MFERARWTNSAKENTFKKQVSLNKEFSHSTKDSDSNDILMLFVEFSNVDNNDRSSKATQSNLLYKDV